MHAYRHWSYPVPFIPPLCLFLTSRNNSVFMPGFCCCFRFHLGDRTSKVFVLLKLSNFFLPKFLQFRPLSLKRTEFIPFLTNSEYLVTMLQTVLSIHHWQTPTLIDSSPLLLWLVLQRTQRLRDFFDMFISSI